jgi:antitoxin ParD1/3/4
MSQMTVSLSPDLQGYVDARVAAEGLTDSAEFVRAVLERERRTYRDDVARVQALLDEGHASGVLDIEPEQILDEIMADLSTRRG